MSALIDINFATNDAHLLDNISPDGGPGSLWVKKPVVVGLNNTNETEDGINRPRVVL